jgi:hypothetical protein
MLGRPFELVGLMFIRDHLISLSMIPAQISIAGNSGIMLAVWVPTFGQCLWRLTILLAKWSDITFL